MLPPAMLTSKLWLQEGMTPLHHLVQHGQGTPVEVAEVLVEAHPGALAQASKVGSMAVTTLDGLQCAPD